ncbi:NusA-like transcription termination signal-binding factor [Candidatus Woesearchaeota archaeon]|nr:NusA-like transcription termination signal-binding factor [Candidatus Woesearchaeota archaeon]MCF8013654.1 NusA-like transcription termination signal-binding factor [Candidatus Woesearchaeota archaeon]
MKTKYNTELLKVMTLFEKITRARLKDSFENKDKTLFIVQQGQLRQALGKNTMNVKKIEEALGKKIKIIEFSDNLATFIKNLMYPLKIIEMEQQGNTIIVKGADTKTKGLMIGAKAQNLRNYEEIAKKYFPELEEIKVI